MRKAMALAAVIAAGFASATAVQAKEGPLMIRGRILSMQNDNSNSHGGGQVVTSGDPLEANNKVFPEVDFTYFITPNIAAELILTYPQRHDIKFSGTKIGTLKHLPPTLTLQYHFIPDGVVRPYVGAGINYTRFMSVRLNGQPAVGIDSPIDVDRNSFGLAGQVGVDFKVADNWFINLDAKYVKIEAKNVRVVGGPLAGTKVTDLDIDPWLLSVGVGYRF